MTAFYNSKGRMPRGDMMRYPWISKKRWIAFFGAVLLVFFAGRVLLQLLDGTPANDKTFTPTAQPGNYQLSRAAFPDDNLKRKDSASELLNHALSACRDPKRLAELGILWAEADPELGLQLAMEINDHDLRSIFLKALFERWGQLDGEHAMLAALALDLQQRNPRRQYAMASVVLGWASHDPEGAAQWLTVQRSVPGGSNEHVEQTFTVLFAAWGSRDPQAALSWLSQADDLPAGVSQALGAAWAKEAPEKALNAAMAQHSMVRIGLIRGALQTWSRHNASAAVRWYMENIHPEEIDFFHDTVSVMNLSLNNESPDAAFDWANGMENQTLRTQMLQDLTFVWGRSNPAASLESLREQLRDDEEVRSVVTSRAVKQWAHRDPAAAVNWLASFPVGDAEGDQLTYDFVMAINDIYPQEAIETSLSLSDAGLRSRAIIQSAGYWVIREPESFKEWVAVHLETLEPDTQIALLRLLRNKTIPQ